MTGDNNNNYKPNKKGLAKIFLEVAKPNERGFSHSILIEDLVKIDKRFATGNGGHWCRSDGMLKEYNIIREKNGTKIVSVRLDGFNKNAKNRPIKNSIRKAISAMPCSVLAIGSQIECDHKDGVYDDKNVGDTEKQTISDFQPLSKAANMAKRTHCKQCQETGIRFDAKRLGYTESYIEGSSTTNNCSGCYWYDPQFFNKTISQDFKKEY